MSKQANLCLDLKVELTVQGKEVRQYGFAVAEISSCLATQQPPLCCSVIASVFLPTPAQIDFLCFYYTNLLVQ